MDKEYVTMVWRDEDELGWGEAEEKGWKNTLEIRKTICNNKAQEREGMENVQ